MGELLSYPTQQNFEKVTYYILQFLLLIISWIRLTMTLKGAESTKRVLHIFHLRNFSFQRYIQICVIISTFTPYSLSKIFVF